MTSRAEADDLARNEALSPALARIPARGELAAAAETSVASDRARTFGVGRAQLWYTVPFVPRMTFGAGMALVGDGRDVRIGSTQLSATEQVAVPIGPLALTPSLSVGARLPGAADVRVAHSIVSERKLDLHAGYSLSLSLRRLGLGAAVWGNVEAAPLNGEAFLDGPHKGFAVRVGVMNASASPVPYLALSARVSERVELALMDAHDPDTREWFGGWSARWLVVSPHLAPSGVDVRDVSPDASGIREVSALAVHGKTTIVEVGAVWCGPCQITRPKLIELAKRRGLAVRFVDVDDNPSFAKRNWITALPTMFVFAPDGHLVISASGVNGPAFEESLGLTR